MYISKLCLLLSRGNLVKGNVSTSISRTFITKPFSEYQSRNVNPPPFSLSGKVAIVTGAAAGTLAYEVHIFPMHTSDEKR